MVQPGFACKPSGMCRPLDEEPSGPHTGHDGGAMVSLPDAIYLANRARRARGLGLNDLCNALNVPARQRDAVRSHGRLGALLGVLPIQPQGPFFDVVEGGQLAVILAAYDRSNDWPVDLAAIRLDRPRWVFRLLGVADALGGEAIVHARHGSISYLKTGPATLTVYASPLDWLRSGCHGCAILNHSRTPAILADIDQCIASPAGDAPTLYRLTCAPKTGPG